MLKKKETFKKQLHRKYKYKCTHFPNLICVYTIIWLQVVNRFIWHFVWSHDSPAVFVFLFCFFVVFFCLLFFFLLFFVLFCFLLFLWFGSFSLFKKDINFRELFHSKATVKRIRDFILFRRVWTIGRSGERGSGISMLAARHDDDDDDDDDESESESKSSTVVRTRL